MKNYFKNLLNIDLIKFHILYKFHLIIHLIKLFNYLHYLILIFIKIINSLNSMCMLKIFKI